MGTSRKLVVQIQNFATAPTARGCNASSVRRFRSKAALDALQKASKEKPPSLVLYNYPSFSGAFAAIFASLYHSRLNLPCLVLPFSSVEPLRVEDVALEGIQRCYLLDFIGPKRFLLQLSQLVSQVTVFDHRKSTLAKIPALEPCPPNLVLRIDTEKTTARSAFNYFSSEIMKARPTEKEVMELVHLDEAQSLMTVLKYVEDGDLRRYALPDIQAFNIGLRQEWSKLNCLTNPSLFEQLLKLNAADLISKGNLCMRSRKDAAINSLGKVFRIRLGKGLYGECLGTRADGNSDMSNEISEELGLRSAEMGLRPIGAVVYMQRGNLKMCLRSLDSAADTSEIAKAYGGGVFGRWLLPCHIYLVTETKQACHMMDRDETGLPHDVPLLVRSMVKHCSSKLVRFQEAKVVCVAELSEISWGIE
ncbi:hypothetical protein H6P81_020266 [Aristolochia fimbriata]|uniref:Uncharacterized protein n=1 Tax=Aristolochia fimbriata TaxID=158543 RepID=A0AAV7DWY5_ARIFI|nr:hypothetical protein H6P81_020266 [Aristolochia fimbriata]